MELLDKPLSLLEKGLREKLLPVLQETRDEAGVASASRLRSGLRAAGKFRTGLDAPRVEFAFDTEDPRAAKWVEDYGGELIDGITGSTRDEIVALLDGAFTEQVQVDELAGQIADVIGDDARAETIARTETMAAANAGQREAWAQAVDDGLLTGNELREWIASPDDRLCPECEGLDGQTARLDDDFEGGYGDPPAHPDCRCTTGLVVS